jgi:hypothetical protein
MAGPTLEELLDAKLSMLSLDLDIDAPVVVQWPTMLEALRKQKPIIVMTWLGTLANAWATSHRMHS